MTTAPTAEVPRRPVADARLRRARPGARVVVERSATQVELPEVQATSYTVCDFDAVEDDIRASAAEVEMAIGDANVRLMDVRSVAEYTGERCWPSLPPEGAQRGGN